jgi:hypothetical protein
VKEQLGYEGGAGQFHVVGPDRREVPLAEPTFRE